MRLSQIRQVISDCLNDLQVNLTGISNSSNVSLSGFREATGATLSLKETGILQEEVSAVLSHFEIVNCVSSEIVVHTNTGHSFYAAINDLRTKASIVCSVCNEFLGQELPHHIHVKLPCSKDLDKTIKDMASLKLALEQALLHPIINGNVELVAFERGSSWIEISLGGMLATRFLSDMLKLVYYAKNKEKELEAKREMVRHLQLQNDLKEKVIDAIDDELEAHYSQSIDGLLTEVGIDPKEPEYPNRLAHSLRLLTGLIGQGLEVHPALLTPPEDLPAFPDPKLLLETLKGAPDNLLSDGTSEDSDAPMPAP